MGSGSPVTCRDHSGKSGFATDELARAALRTIRRRTDKGTHIPVRFYRCGQCHERFLTSAGREGRWV